jgi:hypothetical protein
MPDILIRSFNNQLQIDSKNATYEEIADIIAKEKTANQQKGVNTIVTIHPLTPEDIYKELINKSIDTSDWNITIVYNKYTPTIDWDFNTKE